MDVLKGSRLDDMKIPVREKSSRNFFIKKNKVCIVVFIVVKC